MADKDETEKAVEAVDKMEDDAAEKRDAEEFPEDKGIEEENIIACPKCKRPVTEGDFLDKFSDPMEDTTIARITCPQCGYSGMPIELTMKDFKTWVAAGKK